MPPERDMPPAANLFYRGADSLFFDKHQRLPFLPRLEHYEICT